MTKIFNDGLPVTDNKGRCGYEVVCPLGKLTSSAKTLAPRLDTLEGKRICELSDHMFKTEETLAALEEFLLKRYAGIEFVSYTKFGNIHGSQEREVLKGLPDKLKEYGCDAVIAGNGC